MLVLVSTSVLCPSSTGLGPVWVVVITSDRSTQAQTPPPRPRLIPDCSRYRPKPQGIIRENLRSCCFSAPVNSSLKGVRHPHH